MKTVCILSNLCIDDSDNGGLTFCTTPKDVEVFVGDVITKHDITIFNGNTFNCRPTNKSQSAASKLENIQRVHSGLFSLIASSISYKKVLFNIGPLDDIIATQQVFVSAGIDSEPISGVFVSHGHHVSLHAIQLHDHRPLCCTDAFRWWFGVQSKNNIHKKMWQYASSNNNSNTWPILHSNVYKIAAGLKCELGKFKYVVLSHHTKRDAVVMEHGTLLQTGKSRGAIVLRCYPDKRINHEFVNIEFFSRPDRNEFQAVLPKKKHVPSHVNSLEIEDNWESV